MSSPKVGRNNVREAMICCLMLLTFSALAQGADRDGKYAIKGVGISRCADYVKARAAQSNTYLQFAGWLNGFLTHHNRSASATFDIIPWQSTGLLLGLLESHCKNKPEQRFVYAVDALVNTVQKGRLRERSPKVVVKAGGSSLYLYEETMRQVQRALGNGGYYGGVVDGVFGPKTEAAIRAFQKDKELEITGAPDQATLFSLLLRP